MKRISIILFSVYYLLVVSGVTVHYHYCRGKLASVDLYSQRKNPCPCGEKSAHGCCNHKVFAAKTDLGYKPDLASIGQPVSPEFLTAIAPSIVLYLLPGLAAEDSPAPVLSHWRSYSNVPLFLLYLVLRN